MESRIAQRKNLVNINALKNSREVKWVRRFTKGSLMKQTLLKFNVVCQCPYHFQDGGCVHPETKTQQCVLEYDPPPKDCPLEDVESCGIGNHKKATPICEVCGVNVIEEKKP